MSLSLQYKNNSQKGSYSKRWSALKLLCLYIISCNCQNTGLLKVLAEVLQAFKLHFAALNYLRNRFSNKKNQRAVHGQLGPAIFPSHLRNIRWILCTKHTPNPPLVCLAPLCHSHIDLSGQTPREALHPSHLPVPSSWAPSVLTQLLLPSSLTSTAHKASWQRCSAHVSAFSIF